jgi:hypothetical protein
MLNAKSRSEKVLARLAAHPQLSLAGLARAMDVPDARLKAYAYGRAPFPAELAPALYMAVAEVDPSLALWAFSEVVGLPEIRHEARPLPVGLDRDPVHIDAMQTSEALGQLEGGLARAGAEVDSVEAATLLPDARRARTEMGQVIAKLEDIASRTPQRALALERR